MSYRVFKRVAALAALLLIPSVAIGYGVLVHNLIPARALSDLRSLSSTPVRTTTLAGVRSADLQRFRLWFYNQARTLPDTAVRSALLRRYPTAAAFDARAFKQLLMLDGEAQVFGIDSFAAVYGARHATEARLDPYPQYNEGASLPLTTALAMGSIWVDLDRRHQDRLFRGPDGQVRTTSTGDTVPFDPMTLNMGHLTGATSGQHAHYGFNHLPKSSDPGVLRSAPYNYVVARAFPGPVEVYAEQNAQIWTDLSLLTLIEGGSGMQALSSIYGGTALHYIADVANAVHTVQGGTPGVQNDVTLTRLIAQVKSGFGLWGTVPSKERLEVDIVQNLHTMSEKLFQSELSEALSLTAQNNLDAVPESMRGAADALTRGDTAMAVSLHALVNAALRDGRYPEFGRLITAAIVDESYQDGAEIYRLTRAMANNTVRRATEVLDFDTIPDDRVWQFVASRTSANTQRALRRFNDLQIKGLKRANEGTVAWWYAYGFVAMPPTSRRTEARNAILGRLVQQQLAYLSAAESRRATWIASHGGERH